jgi:hypothetical protein
VMAVVWAMAEQERPAAAMVVAATRARALGRVTWGTVVLRGERWTRPLACSHDAPTKKGSQDAC